MIPALLHLLPLSPRPPVIWLEQPSLGILACPSSHPEYLLSLSFLSLRSSLCLKDPFTVHLLREASLISSDGTSVPLLGAPQAYCHASAFWHFEYLGIFVFPGWIFLFKRKAMS